MKEGYKCVKGVFSVGVNILSREGPLGDSIFILLKEVWYVLWFMKNITRKE